jgi:prepilin-type N-terminal cleavage/methylation domain-containing protein
MRCYYSCMKSSAPWRHLNRGFTLIELLVVIAIIAFLSVIVIVSLNSARTRARDAERISDLNQMGHVLALATGTSGVPLQGCITAHTNVANCTGTINAVDLTQLAKFQDPSGASPCTTSSTGPCQYSISSASGGNNPKTDDYAILGYLEIGVEKFSSGLVCVVGTATTSATIATSTSVCK